MNRYGVKEVFRSIQGEGLLVGKSAVFVRFSGCNLWDGNPLRREDGRATCALYCDADFHKGAVLDTDELLGQMELALASPAVGPSDRLCVLTGGEPALQLDSELLGALKDTGWVVAIETNGTVPNDAVAKLDYICYSPKPGKPYRLSCEPDEVEVVLPGAPPMQKGWSDGALLALEDRFRKADLFVQPQDPVLPGPGMPSFLTGGYAPEEAEVLQNLYHAALKRCVQWVHEHPRWRLSMQVHKLLSLR